MKEILEGHCQAQRLVQIFKFILRHILETFKNNNVGGFIKLGNKSVGLFQSGFS